MDPMLDEFGAVVSTIDFNEPAIPLPDQVCDVDYWVDHVRRAVRFADRVRWLHEQGVAGFVEIGPDGVLTAMGQETVDASFVALQRRDRPQLLAVTEGLAKAHTLGVTVDWRAVFAGSGARRVDLPTYPFQRETYWLDTGGGAGDVTAAGLRAPEHPLLGAVVRVAARDEVVFTSRLSVSAHPWLADHAIGGRVLVPGTGLVELAIRAGDEVACPTVEELVI